MTKERLLEIERHYKKGPKNADVSNVLAYYRQVCKHLVECIEALKNDNNTSG